MLIAECRLRLARPIRGHESPQLRGFFGRKFEDQVLMHNHGPDATLVYQYPRIQFKVLRSHAFLIGVEAGARLLERLWLEIDQTRLGNELLPVLESRFELREESLAVCESPIRYRFLTPWLALNQENFRAYLRSSSPEFRSRKLSRILVGNCLSLGKSLGVRFEERIQADVQDLRSISTSLKGKAMMGFIGRFDVNLRLPELVGLGKSVSRGFGAISTDTRGR